MIKSKTQLVEWVKRKLGHPVINLETEVEQIEDNIDEAIETFTKYSGNASYRNALILTLSAGIAEYELVEGVESVLSIDIVSNLRDGIGILFSPTNQLYEKGFFDFAYGPSGGSLVTYEMGMQYLDMMQTTLQGKYMVRYNKYTHKLNLTPTPQENMLSILEVFTKYDPGTAESTIYNELWVKKYAVAATKVSLGHIWGKYNGIPLPGGGALNAERMLSSGEAEVKHLEESIIKEEGEPLEPSIG